MHTPTTDMYPSCPTLSLPYALPICRATEAYTDRVVELHNARVAAEAGVSAEVIYGDADSGLMLTRCIDGIVTMSPEKFRERAGAPARAAEAQIGRAHV